LDTLHAKYEAIAGGEGHCILVSGEAGIGKTSLVKAFCKEKKNSGNIYIGTCDALFTPRPLAPLYDIARQLDIPIGEFGGNIADRAQLFTRFFEALQKQQEPCLVVFEDIHWADEATLDFIKFLARRITRIRSLFLLTFRDDEISLQHPLRNLPGQLSPDSFTRLPLTPLSRAAVTELAAEKGYSGEDVYSISGGNPFYVTEILASYSTGVPDNVRDSILSVYQRQDDITKYAWQILSVLPTGLEAAWLEKLKPSYSAVGCLDSQVLVMRGNRIFFKHELYRRTIELSLSPFVRIELNKKILGLLLENPEEEQPIEQIIHHAKNANAYDLVVKYAPIAAGRAAAMGAHTEACRLFYTAIEYYQGKDRDTLLRFYESYAYECYLTYRIKEGIIYGGKALQLWKEKNDIEKTGNSLRFLSRLWWFDGNRKQSENYALQAIEALASQPSCAAKAMAFSNMSQLKMLSNQPGECIVWGEKAIAMAKELNDNEILAHALNNVGTVQMKNEATLHKGRALVLESLRFALDNGYHEHAARAYTNMASTCVETKEYRFARETLDEGIQYCEERDLDSWTRYMMGFRARMLLETGQWNSAAAIASQLICNENQTAVVKIGALVIAGTVMMRRNAGDALPLLEEARAKAFQAMELQRIIPALLALLEYEWLTGQEVIGFADLEVTISMTMQMGNLFENSALAFWLL
ncbi:MAG: AAA family ATPase, partial [Bacteroidetes bacterium]|nr:AAA family ATPase [Bacteroidota bacterium]